MEAATIDNTPSRTLAQRRAALREANRIRVVRAELKRTLRSLPSYVAASRARNLILDPPADHQTMYLFDLLMAVPKYGRKKVNRLMVRTRISPSKTLGGLSERQRQELAEVLRSP